MQSCKTVQDDEHTFADLLEPADADLCERMRMRRRRGSPENLVGCSRPYALALGALVLDEDRYYVRGAVELANLDDESLELHLNVIARTANEISLTYH